MNKTNTNQLNYGDIKPEMTQIIYLQFKADCGGSTYHCFEFLNWLHAETNTVHHLLGMHGLTQLEKVYIENLLK